MDDSASLRSEGGYDDKKIYMAFAFYKQSSSNAGQKSYILGGVSGGELQSNGQVYATADQTNQDSLDKPHGMLIIYPSLYIFRFEQTIVQNVKSVQSHKKVL